MLGLRSLQRQSIASRCLVKRLLASSPWAAADAQIQALEEVKAAKELVTAGFAVRAAPLLQRAVDICSSAMGKESLTARAASKMLAEAQYAAGNLDDAQHMLELLAERPSPGQPEEELVEPLLLLTTILALRGDPSSALSTSSRAVSLLERDANATPDMALLGRSLRLHGVCSFLTGDKDEDAEVSLRRAARLGDTSAEQAQAVSVMAAFQFSRSSDADEGPHAAKEAFSYWDAAVDACADPKPSENAEIDPETGKTSGNAERLGARAAGSAEDQSGGGASESRGFSASTEGNGENGGILESERVRSDRRVARACVLCNASQAELFSGAKTSEKVGDRLAEALKLRERDMPAQHPSLGWTLALLARSQHLSGSPITAEGLFRAAFDKLLLGADESTRKTANLPEFHRIEPSYFSPVAAQALAQALEWQGELLSDWEKREVEGKELQERARRLRDAAALRPPVGVSVHMLHLADGWGLRPWL